MTDEAMSPLRRRMIEDMTIRGIGPKTQRRSATTSIPKDEHDEVQLRCGGYLDERLETGSVRQEAF